MTLRYTGFRVPRDTQGSKRETFATMSGKTGLRLSITAGALALVATHFAVPGLRLDAVALGLVVLAVLPWLASIIESATTRRMGGKVPRD